MTKKYVQTTMIWYDENGAVVNERYPTLEVPEALTRENGAVKMTIEYDLRRKKHDKI